MSTTLTTVDCLSELACLPLLPVQRTTPKKYSWQCYVPAT